MQTWCDWLKKKGVLTCTFSSNSATTPMAGLWRCVKMICKYQDAELSG